MANCSALTTVQKSTDVNQAAMCFPICGSSCFNPRFLYYRSPQLLSKRTQGRLDVIQFTKNRQTSVYWCAVCWKKYIFEHRREICHDEEAPVKWDATFCCWSPTPRMKTKSRPLPNSQLASHFYHNFSSLHKFQCSRCKRRKTSLLLGLE